MMEGKIKLYSIPIDGDGFEFMTAVDVDDYDNLVAGAEALAADVARLTADNAALRAQLDAAGWRTLDEPNEGRNKVQFLITDGWFNDVGAPAWASGALIRSAGAGRWVRWRPAPPQE